MENNNIDFSRTALIVFTKTPDVPVKTRIAQTEGSVRAKQIYRELLKVTAESIRDLPYHVAFTGNSSPGELITFFGRAVSFFNQTGDDLGSRMRNACLHCQLNGANKFIVIGCDCPERTADDIMVTINALNDGYNVVIGPVADGGYHLAGIDCDGLSIFDAKKWSTPELMEETMTIAKEKGLKTMLLEMRNDIDTNDDYVRWKENHKGAVY
jgi:rSAM/selenodomain-associated transferase 1